MEIILAKFSKIGVLRTEISLNSFKEIIIFGNVNSEFLYIGKNYEGETLHLFYTDKILYENLYLSSIKSKYNTFEFINNENTLNIIWNNGNNIKQK